MRCWIFPPRLDEMLSSDLSLLRKYCQEKQEPAHPSGMQSCSRIRYWVEMRSVMARGTESPCEGSESDLTCGNLVRPALCSQRADKSLRTGAGHSARTNLWGPSRVVTAESGCWRENSTGEYVEIHSVHRWSPGRSAVSASSAPSQPRTYLYLVAPEKQELVSPGYRKALSCRLGTEWPTSATGIDLKRKNFIN